MADRPIDEFGCLGKLRLHVDVAVDTKEMKDWSPERIKALFLGVSLVQRAMYGMPIPKDPEREEDLETAQA